MKSGTIKKTTLYCSFAAVKLGESVGLRGDGFLEFESSSSSSSDLDSISVRLTTQEEDAGTVLWQGNQEEGHFATISGIFIRCFHTWARGGMGGDAPPLASKNLSPPLEPKIRDLQKKIWPKKGESAFFLEKISLFRDFCTERPDTYFVKKLLVFYSCFL